MRISTIPLAIMWISLIGIISSLIKIALAIKNYINLETEIELINNPIFWNLLNQARLEFLTFIICLGFLLIYYTLTQSAETNSEDLK